MQNDFDSMTLQSILYYLYSKKASRLEAKTLWAWMLIYDNLASQPNPTV